MRGSCLAWLCARVVRGARTTFGGQVACLTTEGKRPSNVIDLGVFCCPGGVELRGHHARGFLRV